MAKRRAQHDYQLVTRSRRQRALADEHAIAQDWPVKIESSRKTDLNKIPTSHRFGWSDAKRPTLLKHGHTFSYTALLLFLGLAVSVWLSLGAINDYRLGLMTVEGYRAGGRGGGIFGNSNDMALFLVTMVPLAIAFLLGSRSLALKAVFGLTGVLMIVG